jgi:opacity protein-like surface antigen
MPKFLLAMAFALAATAAHADNGFYIGGGVSQAKIDDIGSDFDTGDLDDFEIDDTAWKIIAGIRPLSFMAIEANYMDLGDERFTAGPFRARASAEALALYAIGFLPIPIVDVYGKIGAARWEFDGSFEGTGIDDFDDSGTEFAYGAGVQLKLGSLAARLEYEQFDIDNTDGLELLTLGLTYTFL